MSHLNIYLDDVRATVRQWEDQPAAEAATSSVLHVLGDTFADESSIFTLRLDRMRDPRTTLNFGVQGQGSVPPALLGSLWGEMVWVGAGSVVYAIDPENGEVTEHPVESPFMEFFISRHNGVLVVAYESGLLGIAADGTHRWSADTDLVEDLRWEADTVIVQQVGLSSAKIALVNGDVLAAD